jgi:hypothetical protein
MLPNEWLLCVYLMLQVVITFVVVLVAIDIYDRKIGFRCYALNSLFCLLFFLCLHVAVF